jgi:hypothetical protein
MREKKKEVKSPNAPKKTSDPISPKAQREKPKLYLTTRYQTKKQDTEAGKRLLNNDNLSQSSLAYKIVDRAKEPPTFSEILEAYSRDVTGKKESTNINNLRWYLTRLKSEGFLAATENREERGK